MHVLGRHQVARVSVALAMTLAIAWAIAQPTQADASPSGAPIVIGNVGSYSAAGAAGSLPGGQAIEAWSKWVNAHGGINGHPIKLIEKNDQGNQAVAVSDVEQLVQQDHVIAFVANQDGSLITGYSSYLDQQKIPVLGGSIYTLDWNSNPMFFPQGLTAISGEQAAITYAKKIGVKKIGSLACSELAQCSEGNSLLKSLSQSAGLDDTYQAVASSTAPDYTANCLAAQAAGVQLFELLIETSTEGVTIAQDCARQNYHPDWVIPGEAMGPGYLTTASFDNAYNFSGTQPWYSTVPVTADFRAAMKKYTTINFKTQQEPLLAPDAWASGLMFQKAVQLSGAKGVPTTADILAGLAQFKGQDLGGFTGPLTFTNPDAKIGNCFYVTQIKKQKFVEGNNGKYVCNPS
jgi:branched-chain amino acid transport system substrate-binding protein